MSRTNFEVNIRHQEDNVEQQEDVVEYEPRPEEETGTPEPSGKEAQNTQNECKSETEEDGDWPSLEGAKVEESLKTVLECPVCLEYMTPPITMCVNGHNICKDCRPRLSNCPTCRQVLLGTRNVALENLARSLELPQKKRDEVTLPSAPPEEELEEFETLHGCPMDCAWTGRKEGIRVHMLNEHQEKLLDGTEYNNCQWKLPLIVRDIRVIFAFGEVFRYRLRLHTIKKVFFIAVQYIGPPANACKYKYEVELSAEGQVVVMGNPTLEDHVNLDTAFETGQCVTLDYDRVKKVTQGKPHVYYIRVSKFSTSS